MASPIPAPSKMILYCAGSLSPVVQACLKDFHFPQSFEPLLCTGPAGLLREKLEASERFDLFISANKEHPDRLHKLRLAQKPQYLISNRLVAFVKDEIIPNSSGLLDYLLKDSTNLGISNPKADPSGDYALEFFAKTQFVKPGCEAILRNKAKQLVGSHITPATDLSQTSKPAVHPVAKFFAEGKIHCFLGYASSYARIKTACPEAALVEFPQELAVFTSSYLCLPKNPSVQALDFAEYLLKQKSRFLDQGFMP